VLPLGPVDDPWGKPPPFWLPIIKNNDKDDKSRGNWHTRSLVLHRLRKQARRVGIVGGVARAAHAGAWILVRSPKARGIRCVSSAAYRFSNRRIILPAVYTRSLARCICRSVPIYRRLLSDTITLWISTFSHLWRWNPSPIRWWGRLFANSIAGRSFWIGGWLALYRGRLILSWNINKNWNGGKIEVDY